MPEWRLKLQEVPSNSTIYESTHEFVDSRLKDGLDPSKSSASTEETLSEWEQSQKTKSQKSHDEKGESGDDSVKAKSKAANISGKDRTRSPDKNEGEKKIQAKRKTSRGKNGTGRQSNPKGEQNATASRGVGIKIDMKPRKKQTMKKPGGKQVKKTVSKTNKPDSEVGETGTSAEKTGKNASSNSPRRSREKEVNPKPPGSDGTARRH